MPTSCALDTIFPGAAEFSGNSLGLSSNTDVSDNLGAFGVNDNPTTPTRSNGVGAGGRGRWNGMHQFLLSGRFTGTPALCWRVIYEGPAKCNIVVQWSAKSVPSAGSGGK